MDTEASHAVSRRMSDLKANERSDQSSGQRKDEPAKSWFRSNRLFSVDGAWYFSTREGMEIGPYDTRRDAQVEAGFLMALLNDREPDVEPEAVVQSFLSEARSLGLTLVVSD